MRILILLFLIINLVNSSNLQKAKTYNKYKYEIDNWIMSEKLDGIRAYWNTKELLSKNGSKIHAPKWFIKTLPNFELDGELWTKRNDFENIQNIVLDKRPSKDWNKITYNIFEVPKAKGDFLQRLKKIKNYLKNNPSNFIKVIPQIKCKNKQHLETFLEELVNEKAEGVIIKNPKLDYFTGRSNQILKVKKFYDKEGEIIDIIYTQNRLKSLVLKLKNNVTFKLGTGFSKEERKLAYFKIGEVVTFKYYLLTKKGKPKFASFLRKRKKE